MKSLIALVGTQFRPPGTKEFVAGLPNGEPLTLKREPTNKFDPRAVQVWARGQHIGYLKATQNKATSMTMDRSGAELPAKLAIDGGKWPMVEIDQ